MRLCNSGRTFQLGAIRLTTVQGGRVLGRKKLKQRRETKNSVMFNSVQVLPTRASPFERQLQLTMSAHIEAYVYINLAGGNEYANAQ